MNVLVLSVGKPDRARFAPLFEDYAARVRRFGVGLTSRHVPETRGGGLYSAEHAREREGEALAATLPGRGSVIALTPGGRAYDSEAFARALARWSIPLATFLIGGPTGLSRTVLDAANRRMSLSPMTFPHDIVRVLLVEQIYRALTLSRGVPYHK
jgi:23S rRNA (pseudouridine1915-N3)-methyltransferase